MSGPLSGKKILVTRGKAQAKLFAKKIKAAGGIPIEVPLLRFQKRVTKENENILDQLHEFTWVFFTSANGVKFFFDLLELYSVDRSILTSLNIATVGKKTEKLLCGYGFYSDFIPEVYSGKAMAEEFMAAKHTNERLLLVGGNLSRNTIANELRKQQIFFRIATIYDTLPNVEMNQLLVEYLSTETIDAYTFTSPSAVQAFSIMTTSIREITHKVKAESLCVCIGSTTENKAKQEGFGKIRTPTEFTTDAMIDELIKFFSEKG